MDELHLVRREDDALVVTNHAGVEFRLVVDDAVLTELRQIGRKTRETPRVSPRDIQRLVRAGKSRQEIVTLTGADESDVIRYEEPVLAERRFILQTAHDVAVRTTQGDGETQKFGEVISERLTGLNAEMVEWNTWKEDESGWMLGLEFISHDVAHHAIWAFDHRKSLLSPTNSDSVTLSKQGDLGDRLIPKLRAVDQPERQTAFATPFQPEKLTEGLADTAEVLPASTRTESARSDAQDEISDQSAQVDTQPVLDAHAEFLRRREIDQRSMSTPPSDVPDLSQTADLLDALRRRRDSRDNPQPDVATPPASAGTEQASDSSPVVSLPTQHAHTDPASAIPETHQGLTENNLQSLFGAPRNISGEPQGAPLSPEQFPQAEVSDQENAAAPENDDKPKRARGRAAIPSWDDILFGTRSEEDPAH